jgi:SH3 domain protein
MGTRVRLAGLVILAQLPLAITLAARTTMYVSDVFEIVVRSEKSESTGRNILKLLPTGTPVEVLDTDDAWATVRLADGRTGYTLKRYLIERLPYKVTAERLQGEFDTQRERLQALTEQCTALQEEHRRLQQTSTSQETQLADVQQKYEQLRQGAVQFIQLREDHTQLRQAHQHNQQQLAAVTEAYTGLKQSRSLLWFLSGAGVLLLGWLFGLCTERLRGRRRQGNYSYQLPR